MASLSNMPLVGVIVIIVIMILFGLSLFILFGVYARYKHLTYQISGTVNQDNRFLRYAVNQFADSYKRYGKETNTLIRNTGEMTTVSENYLTWKQQTVEDNAFEEVDKKETWSTLTKKPLEKLGDSELW